MNEPNDIPKNILKYSQRKSIYKKNVVLLCHKKSTRIWLKIKLNHKLKFNIKVILFPKDNEI